MKLLFHRPGLSDGCQKSKVICASQLRSIDSCQNGTCEDHYQITNNVGSNTRSDISPPSKGQCPYYAHARASSVFSSKDNRTVILTRQDFLPDHTADGNLSFIFSSNILDFRRSHLSYIKNWLAVREFFAFLSLAWPPRDPKISFR